MNVEFMSFPGGRRWGACGMGGRGDGCCDRLLRPRQRLGRRLAAVLRLGLGGRA